MRPIDYCTVGVMLMQLIEGNPLARPLLHISSDDGEFRPNLAIIDSVCVVTKNGQLPTSVFLAAGGQRGEGPYYYYWTDDGHAVTDLKAEGWPEVHHFAKIRSLAIGNLLS